MRIRKNRGLRAGSFAVAALLGLAVRPVAVFGVVDVEPATPGHWTVCPATTEPSLLPTGPPVLTAGRRRQTPNRSWQQCQRNRRKRWRRRRHFLTPYRGGNGGTGGDASSDRRRQWRRHVFVLRGYHLRGRWHRRQRRDRRARRRKQSAWLARRQRGQWWECIGSVQRRCFFAPDCPAPLPAGAASGPGRKWRKWRGRRCKRNWEIQFGTRPLWERGKRRQCHTRPLSPAAKPQRIQCLLNLAAETAAWAMSRGQRGLGHPYAEFSGHANHLVKHGRNRGNERYRRT